MFCDSLTLFTWQTTRETSLMIYNKYLLQLAVLCVAWRPYFKIYYARDVHTWTHVWLWRFCGADALVIGRLEAHGRKSWFQCRRGWRRSIWILHVSRVGHLRGAGGQVRFLKHSACYQYMNIVLHLVYHYPFICHIPSTYLYFMCNA